MRYGECLVANLRIFEGSHGLKTVKLGLVGVGRIGQMHARNLVAVKERMEQRGVELQILLADANNEFAKKIATELEVESRDSVVELLEAGLDGFVITSNTASHPELLRLGFKYGVPMFCEKPVSSSVSDALPLLREIQDAGAIVQVGHQRRFDAGYLEAKKRFNAGELGWLHSLRAITGDAFPPSIDYIRTSGGLFRDVSVHDFDIIQWLTGQRIVEVYSWGSNKGDQQIGEVGDVDTSCAMLRLEDGTLASVTGTRYNGAGHDVRLDVQGSRATAVVGLDENSAFKSAEHEVRFPTGQSHETFAQRFHVAYVDELAGFVELILGERQNPCTPFEAVTAALVADAAQLSLAQGRSVKIPALQDLLDKNAMPLEVA